MEEYNNVSEEMLEKSNIQIVELEHGCRICCERMTGKFYQTNITIGQEGKIHLASLDNCKPKDQTVFVVHSHPPQLGGASEQDLNIHRNGFGDKNNPMNHLTLAEENKIKMSSPVSAGWGRIAPPYIGSKFPKKDKTSKIVPRKEDEPLNKRLVYGYDVIEIEILLGGVRQMPHLKRLNPDIEGK